MAKIPVLICKGIVTKKSRPQLPLGIKYNIEFWQFVIHLAELRKFKLSSSITFHGDHQIQIKKLSNTLPFQISNSLSVDLLT